MDDINFYTYRDGTKHKYCKACLTMHIDNFDPSTFLYILEEFDVPWMPWEWNKLRDAAYAKNPRKMNGMSVIGKYFSKMRLKQHKNDRWADSERLRQQHDKNLNFQAEQDKAYEEQIRKNFQNGQISEAQYRTLVSTQFQKQHEYIMSEKNGGIPPEYDPIGADNAFREEDFISQQEMPDLTTQLTLEDKQYLAMKWGRTYKMSEWVQLQKKYTQMMQSFDIQDADSKNTLIFICKTYLKMNQAIDIGDVEGYQKLSRVYDTLRKSAKFTAAQNKEDKNQFIDSVGQLVAYCQKNGGQIPRYQVKVPYDILDKIINDLKEYNRSLVYQDTALARQIQDYIKQARAAAANKKDRVQAKQQGYDVPQMSDEDIMNFKQFIQNQEKATQNEINKGDGQL